MLKIQIAGYTIHKKDPAHFLFIRKIGHSYSVTVTDKGLICDCKEFYKNKTCKHFKIVYNMLFVIDIDQNSFLHQQYWNLLNSNGLGKDPLNDYNIRLESLDEVTFENEKYLTGKYYSRIDGRFILINITK